MIHPITGHECRGKELDSDYYERSKFTITVYPSEHAGEDNVWLADIQFGGDTHGQMTHGTTPAQAVFMAYDVVRMIFHECEPEKAHLGLGGDHCYCRDVTTTGAYPNSYFSEEDGKLALLCCRCGSCVPASFFKPLPEAA